jgi:hypothetical protein
VRGNLVERHPFDDMLHHESLRSGHARCVIDRLGQEQPWSRLGQVRRQNIKQAHRPLKLPFRNHRDLKVGPFGALRCPVQTPLAKPFGHAPKFTSGRSALKDTATLQSGHMPPLDQHWNRNLGQTGKAPNLVRCQFVLNAALKFIVQRSARLTRAAVACQ